MSGFGKRVADGLSWSLGKHGFIIYPSSTNGYISGLLDDGENISARLLPVDYAGLFLDGSALVDGEGNTAKNTIKSFGLVETKQSDNFSYKPLGDSRLLPLLSGNQFVYDGKDCYSYWGSSFGDLPIRIDDISTFNELSPYEVFGFNLGTVELEGVDIGKGIGFFMFDINGNQVAAPVNRIYKNGKLARVFNQSIVIGLGIFDNGSIKKILIALSTGEILICSSTLVTEYTVFALARSSLSLPYAYQTDPYKTVMVDIYDNVSYFNGYSLKFSDNGSLLSLIVPEIDSVAIKTRTLTYTSSFLVSSISITNYSISHIDSYSHSEGGGPYQITVFNPADELGQYGFYEETVPPPSSDSANESGSAEETGQLPIAINYIGNTLRIAFIEIDSTSEMTGELNSSISYSGQKSASPNGWEAIVIGGYWYRTPSEREIWTNASGTATYSKIRSINRNENIYIKCSAFGDFSAINIPIHTLDENYNYSFTWVPDLINFMTAEWRYIEEADAYTPNYTSYETPGVSYSVSSTFSRTGIRRSYISYLDLKTNTYSYAERTVYSENGSISDGVGTSSRTAYEKNIKLILPDQTLHTIGSYSFNETNDFTPIEVASESYGFYYALYWEGHYNYIPEIGEFGMGHNHYWQQTIGWFCCPIDSRNDYIRYVCSYDVDLNDIFSIDEPDVPFERHNTLSSLTNFNSAVSTYLQALTGSTWSDESIFSLFPIGVC